MSAPLFGADIGTSAFGADIGTSAFSADIGSSAVPRRFRPRQPSSGSPFRDGDGYHVVAVELRRFSLERYKGYAQRTEVELAPLTILVGPNNSGKTALAQAIQLLAGHRHIGVQRGHRLIGGASPFPPPTTKLRLAVP